MIREAGFKVLRGNSSKQLVVKVHAWHRNDVFKSKLAIKTPTASDRIHSSPQRALFLIRGINQEVKSGNDRKLKIDFTFRAPLLKRDHEYLLRAAVPWTRLRRRLQIENVKEG